MSLTKRWMLTGAALGVLLGLLGAAPALAAGAAPSGAAQNLADQLLNWAKLILVPIAAFVALPALFRRDVGHAMVVLVIVIIVGMFSFDPQGVGNFVQSVATAVLG